LRFPELPADGHMGLLMRSRGVADLLAVVQEGNAIERKIQNRGSQRGFLAKYDVYAVPVVIVIEVQEARAAREARSCLLPLLPDAFGRFAVYHNRRQRRIVRK